MLPSGSIHVKMRGQAALPDLFFFLLTCSAYVLRTPKRTGQEGRLAPLLPFGPEPILQVLP
jgi:hypothetical protein